MTLLGRTLTSSVVGAGASSGTKVQIGDGSGGFSAAAATASQFVKGDGSGAIVTSLARRVPTVIISASDSIDGAGADVQCTGTADQVLINAALAAAPAGALILFRAGIYSTTDDILVVNNAQHLMGESLPHWNAWGGGYPTTDTIGTPGGAQIKQTVSAKNGINIQTAHGTTIENFYLISMNGASYRYTGTGILLGGELARAINNNVNGWSKGIDMQGDTGMAIGNKVSEIASTGIRSGSTDQFVGNNVIYSCNAYCVLGLNCGLRVYNNQIAQFNFAAIQVSGRHSVIEGNEIFNNLASSSHGIYLPGGGNGATIINANTIHLSTDTDDLAYLDNTSGNGIQIGGVNGGDGAASAVNQCVITNNIITNLGGTNSTGYAINFKNGSTNCVAMGNVIRGTRFNSGGAATILWGTGNTGSGLNPGDA